MIQIHKHDKGELYSIYGFFIDPPTNMYGLTRNNLWNYTMRLRK